MYLCGPDFSFAIMNSVHEPCVAPILYHIVRAVVNLNLNCITSIVDEEDDTVLFLAHHGGNVLAGHLHHFSMSVTY